MARIGILIALVVVLSGTLVYMLFNQSRHSETARLGQPLWQLEAVPDCDLHQRACRASLDGERWVELAIEPGPIRMLSPLAVAVRLHGIEASAVAVDFDGVEMSMGFNRPALAPQEAGHFAGTAILPLCVFDSMTWRASVLIETEAGQGIATFYFETSRR